MTKINNVINLYEDRKISQFTTAVNLINGMTIGNAKAKEKGIKQYEKTVAKYEDKAPITERMRATVKKARKGKEAKEVVRKTYKQPVLKRKAIGGLSTKAKDIFKGRKNYDFKNMLFSINNRSGAKKASFILDGVAYYPLPARLSSCTFCALCSLFFPLCAFVLWTFRFVLLQSALVSMTIGMLCRWKFGLYQTVFGAESPLPMSTGRVELACKQDSHLPG